ncbi:hypothetical protein ONZ45_g5652 [Pleurotus djamor]|nr:hypothetical protein ONZ45_g5652 [Pleurotus djamor]
MPNIRSMTFQSSTEDELTKEMTEIIPKLRFLNTLHIQMAYLTPKVTEALARLPCLRLLSGDGSYDDLEYVFSDKLQPESFPVLEELSLFMDMDRTAVCFSSSFAPTCLKNLSIGARYAVPATSFASTIHWAACQTPLLESLSICVDPEDPMGPFEAVEDILPLLLSVMRPLYTCAHLSSLAISYSIPISMEESELIALVTALPTLRRLDLGQFQTIPPTDTDNSNSTSSPSQPGISSSFLPTLAPLCASLEFLCLYISFNNLSNPESLPVVTTRFKSLRTFDVWQSPCKDSSPVVAALFMGRLLPSFCELTYRKTRRSAWKDVISALQVVRMARSDGVEECGSTLAC